MFTILWSAKKRYSLAYQRLKHRINCKMIKLIEFDEVIFYSVVLASMEWVNSVIYKPGIFFWHFRYMYVLFYWYADWNYCNFHIWHSRNFSMSSILKNTSSTQHSFFFLSKIILPVLVPVSYIKHQKQWYKENQNTCTFVLQVRRLSQNSVQCLFPIFLNISFI